MAGTAKKSQKKETKYEVLIRRIKEEGPDAVYADILSQKNGRKLLKLANSAGWTVAHEMAAEGYMFKVSDNTKDRNILQIADARGWTVAHEMVRRNIYITTKNGFFLRLADRRGWTVAHEMVYQALMDRNKKWVHILDPRRYPPIVEEILKIEDPYGWTPAHVMGRMWYLVSDFDIGKRDEILSIADKQGWTVAHEMADQGYVFTPGVHNSDVLKLTDKGKQTVAFVMAKKLLPRLARAFARVGDEKSVEEIRNTVLNFAKNLRFNRIMSDLRPQFKTVVDGKTGRTLAHILAECGFQFNLDKDMDILKLADKTGWTVLHEIVRYGYKLDELFAYRDLFAVADERGWTVAHEMARKGFNFSPFSEADILSLADENGTTVAHVMVKRGYEFPTEEEECQRILNLADKNGVTVADLQNQQSSEQNSEQPLTSAGLDK